MMTGLGLIAAERQRQIERGGWTSEQAIDHVRGSRSPMCLCNPGFESWLRELS